MGPVPERTITAGAGANAANRATEVVSSQSTHSTHSLPSAVRSPAGRVRGAQPTYTSVSAPVLEQLVSGVPQPPARVEALGHPSVGEAGADLEQPAGLARDEHREEGGQGASVATRGAVGWLCGARAHVSSVASGVRWAMNQYSPSTSSTSSG